MIYTLGSEYLGLSSLFTSVLNVLSLAELGVGSAMVYAMYKPVAEKDQETICALLNLYKKIYRIIGSIIVVCGIAILPFIRNFISGDVPEDVNIYLLFIIYMINTAGSYFLFAYQASVLNASQRNDVSSKVNMVTGIVKNVCQIIVLILWKNYYCYVIFLPLTSIAANIIIACIARKMYPQYVCRGKVEPKLVKEIKGKVLALLVITYPWQTWMIHKKLFHCSMWPYFGRLGIYSIVTIAACGAASFLCGFISGDGVLALLIKAIICIVSSNIIFFICSFKTQEFKIMMATVNKVLKRG